MTRLAIIAGAVLIWTVGAVAIGAYITHLQYQSGADYIEGTQDADQATDTVRRVGACNWLRETFGGEGCGVAGPDTPAD